MQSSTCTELSTFAEDVLRGLSSTPKSLSSKYFYDDEGTRLFQEIMKLPEYYLTGCENEIFREQADAIYRVFANGDGAFDLVELCAKFTAEFPTLRIETRTGDYFKILQSLKNGNGRRKVLLFLGSNIGNFNR